MPKKNEILDSSFTKLSKYKYPESSILIYFGLWVFLLFFNCLGLLMAWLFDSDGFFSIVFIGVIANGVGLFIFYALFAIHRQVDISIKLIQILIVFKFITDGVNFEAFSREKPTIFLFQDLTNWVIYLTEWTDLPRLFIKYSLLTSLYVLVVILVFEFYAFFSKKVLLKR